MRVLLNIFTSILLLLIIACTGPSKKIESKNIYANSTDDRPYDDSALEDIHQRLKAGKSLPNSEIEELAFYATTRGALYELLSQYHKEEFFPSKYYNFEKAAESALVHWLVYPTELDTVPSNIQLLKTVSFTENALLLLTMFLNSKQLHRIGLPRMDGCWVSLVLIFQTANRLIL